SRPERAPGSPDKESRAQHCQVSKSEGSSEQLRESRVNEHLGSCWEGLRPKSQIAERNSSPSRQPIRSLYRGSPNPDFASGPSAHSPFVPEHLRFFACFFAPGRVEDPSLQKAVGCNPEAIAFHHQEARDHS